MLFICDKKMCIWCKFFFKILIFYIFYNFELWPFLAYAIYDCVLLQIQTLVCSLFNACTHAPDISIVNLFKLVWIFRILKFCTVCPILFLHYWTYNICLCEIKIVSSISWDNVMYGQAGNIFASLLTVILLFTWVIDFSEN